MRQSKLQLLSPFATVWLFSFWGAILQQVQVCASSSYLFGTKSGYDRGGTDPICSVSTLRQSDLFGYANVSPPAPSGGSWLGPGIDELSDFLVDGFAQTNELLPSCYAGTGLLVQPQGGRQQQLPEIDGMAPLSQDHYFYYTNDTLRFRLELQLDVDAIQQHHGAFLQLPQNSTTNDVATTPSMSSYARVVLCNVVLDGFCTPLLLEQQKEQQAGNKTTIASDWKQVPWSTTASTSNQNTTTILIQLDLPSSPLPTTSNFFAIGHVATSFVVADGAVLRYDVANMIDHRIVTLRPPPHVLNISLWGKLWLGCMIGVCGSLALAMLLYLWWRRDERVLQLAQGKYLAAIALACWIQISCSFVFLPTHRVFCTIFGMVVLLPMTFVASCLVGRVWRVHKTLSLAQTVGRRPQVQTVAIPVERGLIGFLDILAKFASCRLSLSRRSERRSIRETTSNSETMGLIFMLSLPQLLFQIYVLVRGRNLVYIQDPHGLVSRLSCDAVGMWTTAAGLAYMMVIFILALSMAWVSRSLPSAFNEKDQIFRAASISTALACLSMILWQPITDAKTTPFFSVLLQATLSISVAIVVLFTIVWPKIRRCQSGEKVVMSTLVSARQLGRTQQSLKPILLSKASEMSSVVSKSNRSLPSSIALDMKSRQSSTSSLFYDRNSNMLPTIQSGVEEDISESEATNFTETTNNLHRRESARTLVRQDDPLPAELETLILGVQGTLREITKRLYVAPGCVFGVG